MEAIVSTRASTGLRTSTRTRWAGVALAGAMLLVAAACGQKPGVAGMGAAGAEGTRIDPATGELINPTTGSQSGGFGTNAAGGTSGSTNGASGGGSTGAGTGAGPGDTPGDAPAGTTASGAPAGGVTTGVTDDTITIGLHAPLTGAAPIPSDSFDKGKDLYFRWMKDLGKSVFGRDVNVVVRNDNYNPAQAVAVCKEMVEKDHVFLLVGAAGTDQIQACARYAASVNVPYLSVGVTEVGLEGLDNYFALTTTYPDQGPMLADYLVSDLGAKSEKNGMLRFNTPNFQDAHDTFANAMSDRGAGLDYDRAVSKEANTADATTVVQEMKTQGIQNVYVLTSPVWWLQVLQAAAQQNYHPQWVGVGITMTFDTVANAGCASGQAIDGAKFFAAFPAWIQSDQFDPDFRKAMAKFYPQKNGGDDFMWALWATGKALSHLLALPGQNLTRERFIYYLSRAQHLSDGIGPEVNFTPADHWGADQVHLSQANCSDRRWHTIKTFVSDF
jgi:ABC-type branched-subunit amino acid transport system substrate-binding protein